MQGIVIAGTHSGCGKTTITLGLLAALIKKDYKVQPFKAGPDFIDAGLHRLITGRASRNLDLWMCGREYVSGCFQKNAADADIAVIEGVMGMYDGHLSTACLAAELGLPVILVVDAYGMAESAGAVVKGFVEYGVTCIDRKGMACYPEGTAHALTFAGVIFNRIASDRHYRRVKDSVQDVPVLGYLPRDMDFNIPHRHLGLVVAEEGPIQAGEIDKLADAVLEHIEVETIIQNTEHPLTRAGRTQSTDTPPIPPLDKGGQGGGKIAVAYDKAFCFYYEDNFDLLRQAGAEIMKFSPLSDDKLPDDIDALYIGGGYPELHARELSANRSMLRSVKDFSDSGMPVYAECGGFMYLTEGIYDFDNIFHSMAGVFPFKTIMKKGRSSLGYREAVLKERSILGKKGAVVRGHEFHYSEIEKSGQRSAVSSQPADLIYSVQDGSGLSLMDEGYRIKNTIGSYIHVHFGSSGIIAANFVDFILSRKGSLRGEGA